MALHHKKKRVQNIFIGIGLFLSLLTLASLCGRFYWLLDVFSHYHLQYTIGLALALVASLFQLMRPQRLMRSRAQSADVPPANDLPPVKNSGPVIRNFGLWIMSVALLINLYLVGPFFVPAATSAAQAPTEGPPFRVMAMNISTGNAGYAKVIELIRQRQPDIVFMSEVREDLIVRLEAELADSYPYLHAVPSRMTLGIAFLSRHPFASVETVNIAGEGRGRRYLQAEIAWQGHSIRLAGIHPLPPFNQGWAAGRNREIALMGQLSQEATQPFILLGDLNASPWSHPMRQLMANTDLHYAMQGHGVWPTWRLAGPLLGAPLDYILVSPAWRVADYWEEGDIASDHIPIQADLFLPAEANGN